MKIHSDILTVDNIQSAARKAGVSVIWETFTPGGSRSRRQSFIVHLSGSSPYRAAFAGNNGYKAATWDEWGMFLAALFDVDPELHTGKNSYPSREYFDWSTGNRYDNLTPAFQHIRHNWQHVGTVVTGSYHVSECDCGAVRRFMAYGRSFNELVIA